jgi:hypothetical protein
MAISVKLETPGQRAARMHCSGKTSESDVHMPRYARTRLTSSPRLSRATPSYTIELQDHGGMRNTMDQS